MVAQVGPTSVGPVSSFTGVENPAWATTSLRFSTLVVALLIKRSAYHVQIQVRGDLPHR
ncbi:ash family protein [Enterobacter hormaechei]|nr:ash family protein [Enterobacter hormaechei]